jgi:N-acetylneuraminate synthase
MKIRIGKRSIGDGEPCFIIAEAGVNHNGDIRLAKKLVRIAAAAKADAVKFQTWITDEVVTETAAKAAYQIQGASGTGTQYEMLKKLELDFEDFVALKEYSEKHGIIFLSSADDEESTDFLDEIGVPAFKAGSGILNNTPVLRHIARKGRPVILSTGMATLDEVRTAVTAIRDEGNRRIVLLQCTSGYPASYRDIHLRAMLTLKNTFRTVTGLSDHSLGIEVPIAAVALGARVIEKHFTFNKKADGVDQKASINPAELRRMVEGIRNVEAALGRPEKQPVESEFEIMKVSRESIVAASEIPKNTVLTDTLLTTKRPGTGIPPDQMHMLLGKRTNRVIKRNELISFDMLSG